MIKFFTKWLNSLKSLGIKCESEKATLLIRDVRFDFSLFFEFSFGFKFQWTRGSIRGDAEVEAEYEANEAAHGTPPHSDSS